MNRILIRALAVALPILCSSAAGAAECAPGALGVSRTIVVDPAEHGRIGSMNYLETLPLAHKEVVLTFDDGPLPPYSNRILDMLAAECVRATYFMVGQMARAYPELTRRIHDAGHTIGTHSLSHPQPFGTLGLDRSKTQVDGGIELIAAALGEGRTVAPFFRFPGLGRTDAVEEYLATRGLMAWSADFPADDWRHIGAQEVLRRALSRLEARGKGILLLHDIQPATVLALPALLQELKTRGYRIVHVVPATADRPKTVTAASEWRLRPASAVELPVLLTAEVQNPDGEAFARLTEAQRCTVNPPREKAIAFRRKPQPVEQTTATAAAVQPRPTTTGQATAAAVTADCGEFLAKLKAAAGLCSPDPAGKGGAKRTDRAAQARGTKTAEVGPVTQFNWPRVLD